MLVSLQDVINRTHTDIYKEREDRGVQLNASSFSKLKPIQDDSKATQQLDITKKIINASAGSEVDRLFVIEEIFKIIIKAFNGTLTNANIDEVIKEFHVNYFEPLYDGEFGELREALDNEFLIRDTDDFEVKLRHLARIVFQELYGLSVIDGFEFMDGMNEVSCNGKDYIWVQYNGVKRHLPNLRFISEAALAEVAKKAVSFDSKLDLSPANPEILCQRFSGSRVTALHPPYCESIQLNIRNFDITFRQSSELVKRGVTTDKIEAFIDNILPGRPGVVVIGDQGTGKTTYVLRMVNSLPEYLAIGTMEPMFELNLRKRYQLRNIVPLQILPAKDPEKCFESFLRLGRDLIINGETRSPEEGLVTIKAMLRQGRGSISTFHTSSTKDFVYDFRNLLMQTGKYTSERSAEFDIARAVDIIILIRINRRTGKRYIYEIAEVKCNLDSVEGPVFELITLFKYDKDQGVAVPTHPVSEELLERLLEYDLSEENKKALDEVFEDVVKC